MVELNIKKTEDKDICKINSSNTEIYKMLEDIVEEENLKKNLAILFE